MSQRMRTDRSRDHSACALIDLGLASSSLLKWQTMASSFEKILLVDNIWMKFNYLLARYDCEMEI